MSALPFSRTIAGDSAHKCKWCKKPMEYLDPTGQPKDRVWICSGCDNVPGVPIPKGDA